jgi:hypothetical protein
MIHRYCRTDRRGTGPPSGRSAGAAGALLALAVVGLVLTSTTSGCSRDSALHELGEAQRLSADLLVQFTKGSDAANRAVMADTDDASATFAREAEQAAQGVQRDADALKPLLLDLGYAEEGRLLEDFGRRFDAYRGLDRTILSLAVENTNIKAQRLSFEAAQDSADAFRAAVEAAVPSSDAPNQWRVRALAMTAVADLREIQVLQARHIAQADDAVMTRLEERMATAERGVRDALDALKPAVPEASASQVVAARASFDAFMKVNAEIVPLSRRNSNLRSLALTLNEKGKLTNACEATLRDLRDALAKRTLGGTR